jgi:hypothetical protein
MWKIILWLCRRFDRSFGFIFLFRVLVIVRMFLGYVGVFHGLVT